jgi:hypothetical protein
MGLAIIYKNTCPIITKIDIPGDVGLGWYRRWNESFPFTCNGSEFETSRGTKTRLT